MKASFVWLRFAAPVVAFSGSAAWAQPVLITSPVAIAPGDTSVVDQASSNPVPLATAQITVRGTTLTINGRHTIASLLIERNGSTAGVLTHSAGTSFDYSGGAGTDIVYGLDLTVTGNVELQSGAPTNTIDVIGRGFAHASGPGAGPSAPNSSVGGGGGGHGGRGAKAGANPGGAQYGSISSPSTFGSGGGDYVTIGQGGAGGGCVRLVIGGSLVNGGDINASGLPGLSAAGCGAGGSIDVNAATIAGSGRFLANGGAGTGWGGGAGGRIALHGSNIATTGTIAASGGVSSGSGERGAAGTIYVQRLSQTNPDLILDEGGTEQIAALTTVDLAAINTLTLRNSANALFTQLVTLASPLSLTTGAKAEFATLTSPAGDVTLDGGSTLRFGAPVILQGGLSARGGSSLRFANAATVPTNVLVEGASTLALAAGSFSIGGDLTMNGAGSNLVLTPGTPLLLSIGGNANIGAGSIIDGNGAGFGAAQGPGAGGSSNSGTYGGAGAGHGARGPDAGPLPGGAAYGSITQPIDLGSGGGNYTTNLGGNGGGALRLVVEGALTVAGTIRCDGTPGVSAAGSGSGGSVWIDAQSIAGAGTISANGGVAGGGWGGGSGGRVAAYWGDSSFTGAFRAFGGGSNATARGGAGTVYLKPDAQSTPDLILDAGHTGAASVSLTTIDLTQLRSVSISGATNVRFSGRPVIAQPMTIGASSSAYFEQDAALTGDFTVTENSRATFAVSTSFPGALRLRNSSRLTLPSGDVAVNGAFELIGAGNVLSWPGPGRLNLDLRGIASIDAGSSIDGFEHGYPSGTGPGAGTNSVSSSFGGAGAGHGGAGATAGNLLGGAPYDSATNPSEPGSGGGSYQLTPGGAGGGALRMTVNGTFTHNGSINLNGGAGTSAAGSGSGGSLFLEALQLVGSGTISADGGSTFWGSGGGGRLAIYSCEMTLPITGITARAGISSGAPAQAGSIVFGSSSVDITQQPPSLTILSGRPVEFTVGATTTQSNGQLAYQWRKRSASGEFVAIPEGFGGRFAGTNSAALQLDPTECEDAGVYDCLVSDACGAFPTLPAFIIVDPIADYNDDNGVDSDDVIDFFADWDVSRGAADLTQDGGVDSDDVIFFFARWDLGC